MEDPRSDTELLSALRGGDRDAYVSLWERHVGAAMRHANRMMPSRAEDLVSEAFLAIYQQVTTAGTGPESSFPAYLKAVIRNTAIRWRNEAALFDDAADADRADVRDALSLIARESDASDLLGAFQELPERWQRVLWLSEVADVGRPEIARELGIKPNAVSALHRRARSGLKLQWLTRQVPASLREDLDHAARLFPRYLSEPDDALVSHEVSTHVNSCAMCSDLLVTMRSDARRLQGVTLSAVGFGALSVITPAGAALAPGTVAAAATVLASGAGLASLLIGGLGAFSVGGLLLASILVPPAPAISDPVAVSAAQPAPPRSAPAPSPALPVVTSPTQPNDPASDTPRTGRRIDDPSIDAVDLVPDLDSGAVPGTPTRPSPSDDVPDPSEDGETDFGPGLSTPTAYSGYLAPTMAGTTTPGSTVAIDLNGERYAAPADAEGAWAFDPRGLELPAGTYDYRVWAYDDTLQSPATNGTFTVMPIVIEGFEGLTGFSDMLVDEASTTGLVIAATGPPNGTIWVGSITGHTAMFTLDETGHALKRLRMYSRGWYWLTFRALDADGYKGPAQERPLDVYDPEVIFDPWGPNPEEMTFEFVDP